MNKLEIKGLCKHYKDFDLNDVSFVVPEGAVVGLVGENGAGKSTVIKSIVGAVHPDAGGILFEGRPLSLVDKREKQKIAVVLDDTGLPLEVNLRILDKVLSKVFEKWDSGKYEKTVSAFGLPFDKDIKDFSKGMKMKAAIAVALSRDSELLVLDEPTSGLDPVMRDEILGLLYDYVQAEKRSVLISSHITSDLEKLCDYIVYMQNGKVMLSGEKDELLDSYAVYSCDEKTLAELSPSSVERYIVREYGVNVLAKKRNVPQGFDAGRVSLDDLMLFYSKGERI